MIAISGYRIENILHSGVTYVLYKGKREKDDFPIIIKTTLSKHPTAKEFAGLRHEYEILKQLNIKGVLKPVALHTVNDSLALLFEDGNLIPLKTHLKTRRLGVEDFLKIAVSITETLERLHRGNIIHKNINPDHILIDPLDCEAKLTGFNIASVLPREAPGINSPFIPEGNLSYISPEQTGRMNRTLDYRTDFYSLGVTFYEMLTGKMPFEASDSLEMVHCHLAKQPSPPHEIYEKAPKVVSDIVMKMMAKTAEERYQSAAGLAADLKTCLVQIQSFGKIDHFSIGSHDMSDKFQISQGLYGREREIDFLVELFEQVRGGAARMAMVSGYAGIGKTSLVNEIYQTISKTKGCFISGKFDQLRRNIPYSAVIGAFQGLVRELSSESIERIAKWKEKLTAALGSNGRIIIDVIPEVKEIIGDQPAVPDLGPMESQNRFNLVFLSFIRVFCQKEHPLVIFLDDLQWVDAATLKLIDLMMTDDEMNYLFFIGAYRDNEVDPAHPLMMTLENLQKKQAPLHELVLTPLSVKHISRFIADTISADPEAVAGLADLVATKTNGNPFFISQFLMTLYDQGLLAIDRERNAWRWELDKIRTLDTTENVVDFLLRRLKRLSFETRDILRLAACIGARFDLKTLCLISEKKADVVFQHLLPGLKEDLVVLTSGIGIAEKVEKSDAIGLSRIFRFQHDRVQQAAYDLIDQKDKKKVHLKIGRLLLKRSEQTSLEDDIFDILNHLNIASDLIEDPLEREMLVGLNLTAGRKAKASAAYEPAFDYLKKGLGLLGRSCWQKQYDLTLALYDEATVTACLSSHFKQMEKFAGRVTRNARDTHDKLGVYQCRILGHMARNKPLKALNTGLKVLSDLDMRFHADLSPKDLRRFIKTGLLIFKKKQIEDLIDLPEMTDPSQIAVLQVLQDTAHAAYFTHYELYPQIILKGIRLILEHGNAFLSPVFFSLFGSILCGIMDDIETGYRFGRLGMQLLERSDAKEVRCKTIETFNMRIRHFKEHVRETIQPLKDAYYAGLETGDLQFAGFCASSIAIREYLAGVDLAQVEKEMAHYRKAIQKLNQQTTLNILGIYHQAVMNLTGASDAPWMLLGSIYSERNFLPSHHQARDRTTLHYFHSIKLFLCYMFEKFDLALEHSAMAEKHLEGAIGSFAIPVFHLYGSLTRLAMYPVASKTEQADILKKVRASRKKIKRWADHAPMNHLHRVYLVEAELARVLGKRMQAVDCYERAIFSANENGFTHEEALAHELAGRFWINEKKDPFAKHYMQQAHRIYLMWGAIGKVRHLEETQCKLLEKPRIAPERRDSLSVGGGDRILDLSTMMKASQAISGEIVLDKLLTTLMRIVIENVGAQTGYLILQREDGLSMAAQGAVDDEQIVVAPSPSLAEADCVSEAIVRHVAETRDVVVLNDASRDGKFIADPYVLSRSPKSVLCAPVLHKSELVGVLYFENNLISGAFTPNRLEVLKLLASQIAISIENATLYTDLKSAEQKYRGIFENAVEGMYQTSPNGRFISANPAMARIFGFESPEELMETITDVEHQLYVSAEGRNDFIA
ncbi:AAA family ATPase, partial [Thermodesulfobacteriota bacterium]